jgi:hypothetical protein
VIRTRQYPVGLTAAVLVGAVAVLYFDRDILIPLALAITLALVLSPAVAWLRRLHLPRFAATLLVMFVSLSIAGAVGYVIFNQLLQVVNELPSYRDNINNKLKTLRAPHKGVLVRGGRECKGTGEGTHSAEGGDSDVPPRGTTGRITAPSNLLPVQVVEPAPSELAYIREITQPLD